MGKWTLPVGLLISVLAVVELLTDSEPTHRTPPEPTEPDLAAEPGLTPPPSSVDATASQNSAADATPATSTRPTKPTEDSDKKNSAQAYPPLTLEDWHDITLWRESRGYISAENQAIYETYDEAALSELARNGDTTALQLLAQRARARGDERAAAGLFQEAAVRGSTFALAQVGDIIASDIRAQADPAEQRELALYGLAWYQVAIMRGDRKVQHSHLNPLLKQQALELTDEEQARVDQQAELLYQDLNRYRQHLGMDRFDNSTPESVQRLHRLMFPERARE